MTKENQNNHMPVWAYTVLALISAGIGLASSAVTAKFFVLGLERIEADAMARDVLVATGMLMISTELVAFGLAALLPMGQLRALRTKLIICGALLLGFEAATIYITQVALIQSASAEQTADSTRIRELRESIDNRRASAQSLRANGTTQTASTHAWVRNQGATVLRDALKVEADIEPLAAELVRLQSTVRPNLTSVLGESGMLTYSVIRALLISAMGVVMFGAAGVLLREARSGAQQRSVNPQHQPPATTTVFSAQTPKFQIAAISYQLGIARIPAQQVQTTPGTQIDERDTSTGSGPNNEKYVLDLLQKVTGTATLKQAMPATRIDGKRPQLRSLVESIGKGWCRQISKIPDHYGRRTLMQNG